MTRSDNPIPVGVILLARIPVLNFPSMNVNIATVDVDYWECGDTVAQPTVGQADLSYGLDRGFTFLG
ncbi:hypothetical protein ACHAXS_002134 [Conticribra weissflogii]